MGAYICLCVSVYINILVCVCVCICVSVYICVYILLRRHVPRGFAGCHSFPPIHQLKQGLMWAVVCQALFNITDITNSLAESHFKATRWVLGELSKVNTANWQVFPLKYKVFDKYNTSSTKYNTSTTAVFGSTKLITIFFY